MYRLFASLLFHSDPLHLAVTSLVFVYLGIRLEDRFGSLYFAGLVLGCGVTSNLLANFVNWLLYYFLRDVSRLVNCGTGIGGVNLALLAVHVASSSTFKHPDHKY